MAVNAFESFRKEATETTSLASLYNKVGECLGIDPRRVMEFVKQQARKSCTNCGCLLSNTQMFLTVSELQRIDGGYAAVVTLQNFENMQEFRNLQKFRNLMIISKISKTCKILKICKNLQKFENFEKFLKIFKISKICKNYKNLQNFQKFAKFSKICKIIK